MLGAKRLKELARAYLDPSIRGYRDEQQFLGELVLILARHMDDKLVFKWLCEQILIRR